MQEYYESLKRNMVLQHIFRKDSQSLESQYLMND